MDLQAAHMFGGNRWSVTRLVALACFALACALLIGSLISPSTTYSVGIYGKPMHSNTQS